MRKNEKRIWLYLIFLFIIAVFFVLMTWHTRVKVDTEDTAISAEADKAKLDQIRSDKIKEVLQGQETLIDYRFQGATAYTFISSTGRTDYGDLFVVFEQEEQGEQQGSGEQKSKYAYKRVYENDFTGLKPWKLELGDIDGDGVTDILTSVRKTTYYDDQEKNRLFVFQYIDHKLVKKWTGSQIAGIWKDFAVGELLPAKGEEVIFISEDEGGKEKLGVYSWFDFGFQALAESDSYENISRLRITGENRIELTYRTVQEIKITLTVKNGKMIEVES